MSVGCMTSKRYFSLHKQDILGGKFYDMLWLMKKNIYVVVFGKTKHGNGS